MNTKDKIIKAFQKPSKVFFIVICKLFGWWMSDKLYLSILYRMLFGRKLDWEHPSTFCEKLQWLKLYNRRPEYTTMVDKAAVKKYVADIIGEEYIIPTLGIWDSPEDIEWEKLPNRFVLKCTHDSHSAIIVKDKEKLNKEETCKKLAKSLKKDYYKVSREWSYKNVPHRILAEAYLEPKPFTNDLPDYKFFCFNGKVKFVLIASDRNNPNEAVKFDFFDSNFNLLPFDQGFPHAKVIPSKPNNFEMMKKVAEMLSKDIPQVRVDLYELGEHVLFGEYTFFDSGGFASFKPHEWNQIIGDMLVLPNLKRGEGGNQ